jgi:signal transduction histidine kinase
VVIVLLILLAVVPFLELLEIERLRAHITEVTEPARELVTDLQMQLSLETAAARGYMLTGDTSYVALYRQAQQDRARAYAGLRRLAPRLGQEVSTKIAALDATFVAADSLLSSLLSGSRSAEVPPDLLEKRQAMFSDATEEVASLARSIARVVADYRAEILLTERVGTVLSIGLVLLALASAVWVVRLLRERSRASWEREALLASERSARSEAEAGRRELERVILSRAVLIRGFSHDVKNPLGAADGYLELLEDGILGPLNSRQGESIARARRSLAQALRLIKDLLELAWAETVSADRIEVDLPRLVSTIVEDHQARATAKGLTLSFEAHGVETVASDPVRVRQIVGNLLSNALNYTVAGDIAVAVGTRTEESGDRFKRWAVVSVTDSGPGIPEDQLPRVFQEFQRLDSAAGTEGSGIGLAISRRLARVLGGDLTVESAVGRGSTFTLWLPAD